MVPKEANHPRISPVSALSRINHGLHKARGLNLSPGVLNSAIPTFPPKCSNFLVFQVNSHLLCKLVPPKPGWPDCTRLSNSLAKKKRVTSRTDIICVSSLTKSSARACSPCARRLFFKSFTLFRWSSWFWICSWEKQKQLGSSRLGRP